MVDESTEQARSKAAEWASIVASVSATGESRETYDAATRLHEGRKETTP